MAIGTFFVEIGPNRGELIRTFPQFEYSLSRHLGGGFQSAHHDTDELIGNFIVAERASVFFGRDS